MRYTIDFGPSNTGLTLAMTTWLDLSTLAAPAAVAPTITETPVPGIYYFDYAPAAIDPDLLWMIDAGAGAPDQANRYRRGLLRTSDVFVDQPISAILLAAGNAQTAADAAKTSADQAVTDLAVLSGLVTTNDTALSTAVGNVQTAVDAVVPAVQGTGGKSITDIDNKLGAPTGGVEGTVSADIANLKSDLDTNVVPQVTQIESDSGTILAQQGTPTDGSSAPTEFGRMAAIISSGGGGGGGGGNVGAASDASGDPTVFGQLYATRDAIKAKTDQIPSDFATQLNQLTTNITRLLGLSRENSVLDQTVFDSRNNLTSARLRIFGSKADAVSQVNPTGVYTVTATYVGGTTNIQSYSMVRES